MGMKADVPCIVAAAKHLLVVLVQCVENPMGKVCNLNLANSKSNWSIFDRQE
jgi:hypothetical protein